MSKSPIFTAAAIIGCAVVCLAHFAQAEAATPKKAKPALKAPVVKSLMCEGTTIRVGVSGLAGESRNESQLTFAAELKPASSEALIMGVNGSTVLRAGRHLMMKDETSHKITIPFTDYDGRQDELNMWIRSNGEFAAYSSVKTMTNPARDLMCGFMGAELCSISEVQTRVEMHGVCWPAK